MITHYELYVLTKQKDLTSIVWNYFGKLIYLLAKGELTEDELAEDELVPGRVFCSLCLTEQQTESNQICLERFQAKSSYDISTATTSGLKHLRKRHGICSPLTVEENQQKIRSLIVKNPRLTQELFDLKMTEMMVASYTSFDWLGVPQVRDLFATFCPDFKLRQPDQEASAGLSTLFDHTHTGVMRFFIESKEVRAVSLTFDIHHLRAKKSTFLGINVHFILNGKMTSLMIGYEPLQGFQDAEDLVPIVRSKVNEFSLENKHIIYVTDDGKNLISTVKSLNKIRNPCCVHRLSNFVGVDLKQCDDRFRTLTTSLLAIYTKLVYHSDLLKSDNLLIIKKEINELNDLLLDEQPTDLIDLRELDVDDLEFGIEYSTENATTLKKFTKVRFLSSKFLYGSFARNKQSVGQALLECEEIKMYPSEEDWHSIAKYSEFLERIHHLSLQLSSSTKRTIHLVILIRSELKAMIDEFELFDGETRTALQSKFDSRFPILDVHIAGSLLHPSLKNLPAVERYLSDRGQSKSEFLQEFSKQFLIDFGESSYSSESPDIDDEISFLIKRHCPRNPNQPVLNEVDRYLINESSSSDIGSFWSSKSAEYPKLALLAEIVLCCPASQLTSERSFSKVSLRVSGIHNRMDPRTIYELLFVKQNLPFLKDLNMQTPPENIESVERVLKRKAKEAADAKVELKRTRAVKRTMEATKLKHKEQEKRRSFSLAERESDASEGSRSLDKKIVDKEGKYSSEN